MSKKKMMSLMNSTINHQMMDISARPISVLNKTVYTSGARKQIPKFPNILFQTKKKKNIVRSRGESPKNNYAGHNNLYLAYMQGKQPKLKSNNPQNLNNSLSFVRSNKKSR